MRSAYQPQPDPSGNSTSTWSVESQISAGRASLSPKLSSGWRKVRTGPCTTLSRGASSRDRCIYSSCTSRNLRYGSSVHPWELEGIPFSTIDWRGSCTYAVPLVEIDSISDDPAIVTKSFTPFFGDQISLDVPSCAFQQWAQAHAKLSDFRSVNKLQEMQ